jgi:hypothetical protein
MYRWRDAFLVGSTTVIKVRDADPQSRSHEKMRKSHVTRQLIVIVLSFFMLLPGLAGCTNNGGGGCPDNEHKYGENCICNSGYVRDRVSGLCESYVWEPEPEVEVTDTDVIEAEEDAAAGDIEEEEAGPLPGSCEAPIELTTPGAVIQDNITDEPNKPNSVISKELGNQCAAVSQNSYSGPERIFSVQAPADGITEATRLEFTVAKTEDSKDTEIMVAVYHKPDGSAACGMTDGCLFNENPVSLAGNTGDILVTVDQPVAEGIYYFVVDTKTADLDANVNLSYAFVGLSNTDDDEVEDPEDSEGLDDNEDVEEVDDQEGTDEPEEDPQPTWEELTMEGSNLFALTSETVPISDFEFVDLDFWQSVEEGTGATEDWLTVVANLPSVGRTDGYTWLGFGYQSGAFGEVSWSIDQPLASGRVLGGVARNKLSGILGGRITRAVNPGGLGVTHYIDPGQLAFPDELNEAQGMSIDYNGNIYIVGDSKLFIMLKDQDFNNDTYFDFTAELPGLAGKNFLGVAYAQIEDDNAELKDFVFVLVDHPESLSVKSTVLMAELTFGDEITYELLAVIDLGIECVGIAYSAEDKQLWGVLNDTTTNQLVQFECLPANLDPECGEARR